MIFGKRALCAAAASLLLAASSVRAAVVINEVAFDEPSGDPDWIELFNNGGSAVSINNWSLTDQDAVAGNEILISLTEDAASMDDCRLESLVTVVLGGEGIFVAIWTLPILQ